MRIAVVGPCLKMGGMEAASANIANGLSRIGHAVTYISLFKKTIFFPLDPKVQFVEPNDFNRTSLSIPKSLHYIRKSAGKEQFDGVISIGKLYGAITLAALIGTGNKVFVSERSSPLYEWPRAQEWLCKLIFSMRKPTGVIAQTSIAAKYQAAYYRGTPIKVIHNPVRAVRILKEVQREQIVLAVGRLTDPLKGFDLLVQAFAQVSAPDWKLVFAGGDEVEGGHLMQIADKLGIRNSITFLGQVKDLDAIFARASLFVIPSRSEGFPNALCEAMAAGMPCIAFNFVAGPGDLIIDRENGLLVENGNVPAMAAAIQGMIDDQELRTRLGYAAIQIGQKLDQNAISQQIADFVAEYV